MIDSETFDDFRSEMARLQWEGGANGCHAKFSLSAQPGWLRLYPLLGRPLLSQQENLLLQKVPEGSFVVETLLSLFAMQWGEEAGLIVSGKSEASLGLQYDGRKNRVVLRINNESRQLAETQSTTMKMRLAFEEGGKCSFSLRENGELVPLPFQVPPGAWIGARAGFYSVKRIEYAPAGWADFDYLKIA